MKKTLEKRDKAREKERIKNFLEWKKNGKKKKSKKRYDCKSRLRAVNGAVPSRYYYPDRF